MYGDNTWIILTNTEKNPSHNSSVDDAAALSFVEGAKEVHELLAFLRRKGCRGWLLRRKEAVWRKDMG